MTRDSARHPGSRLYATLLLLAGLTIGCIGVYPHLRFSLDSHSVEYFFYSYDEGHYTAVGVLAVPGRIVSRLAVSVLTTICGGRLDLGMIAADLVFPFLAVALAGVLAASVTRAIAGRLALVFGLLFGAEFTTDLFQTWIPWWSRLMQSPSRSLVVEAQPSLMLFRTPEPQISWSIAFIFLALLSSLVRGKQIRPSRRDLLPFWASSLLLGTSYSPVAAACLLYASLVGCGLAGLRLWRHAAAVSSGILLAFATAAISTLTLFAGSWSRVNFSTSLPTISPLTLVGLAVLALWIVRLAAARHTPRETLLGVTACLTPVLLLNQQLLTGRAMSFKIWEEYAAHLFVVLGLAWLLVSLPAGETPKRWRRAFGLQVPATAVVAAIIIFAIGRQRDIVKWFYPQNAVESAAVQLLGEHHAIIGAVDQVLFDTVTMPQRLHLRSAHGYRPVVSFDDSFHTPPPTLASNPQRTAAGSYHAQAVYEWMWRRGATPEELARLLTQELETGALVLCLFFNVQDIRGIDTNWRAVEEKRVALAIPEIVAAYRKYLSLACRHDPAPVYWVSMVGPEEVATISGFDHSLLGWRQTVDGRVLYLYRQRCEPSVGRESAL